MGDGGWQLTLGDVRTAVEATEYEHDVVVTITCTLLPPTKSRPYGFRIVARADPKGDRKTPLASAVATEFWPRQRRSLMAALHVTIEQLYNRLDAIAEATPELPF